MKLFERDYETICSKEEEDAQKQYSKYSQLRFRTVDGDQRFTHPNLECRKFLWRHNSLFPNNHLEPLWVFKDIDFLSEIDNYRKLIYDNGEESEIQKHIKEGRRWFIPSSILEDYNFGHHDAYLFPELKLGFEYVVDYALLGKNSDGWHVVFVEFEKADCDFILKNQNSESKEVRAGLTQIRNWELWVHNHREYFLKSSGISDKGVDIPIIRFFYCLVVSRRDKMDERAKLLRSQICYKNSSLKIMSFDRLADNLQKAYNFNF